MSIYSKRLPEWLERNQEIKWNGSPLNVILKEDSKTLSEVVVVGYGTQKKANLSGSVAMVDSKELENRPIQNVSSGLQGLMPGVAPNYFNNSDKFWYEYKTSEGTNWYLVDPDSRNKRLLFDRDELAAQISEIVR